MKAAALTFKCLLVGMAFPGAVSASLAQDWPQRYVHLIVHYPGSGDIDSTIERGELHGGGWQWTRYVSGRPEWIASGKIKPLIQIGLKDDRMMKGTPKLLSLTTDERQRAIYRIFSSAPRFARAMWVARKVPADRVQLLRAAFSRTRQDPDLLAKAAKANLEISPTSVADVEAAATEIAATPPLQVQVLRELLKDHKYRLRAPFNAA